ncbi:MAG: proline--tRNA ligase [Leptospiraceae bacterium]|nr:proline--tRNA ligase [Leptospiraceae bacterium]
MKASEYILPTTKDDPSDAVVASHKLMIRAGLVRKSSAGLYNFLPLGYRVLRKIEAIVREEMDRSGALEFYLPILTPSDLWETSGRWDRMGHEMFRITDRHKLSYALGPTHEESFASLLKPILKSYKDLPKNVYQMHTKFRDEIRPRFGVIRSREFIMKDAYSFHLDSESLNDTYELMRKTYRTIFKRCGLKTIPVQADSGSMGGSGSEEFMVISPIGEETLSICPSCGYSGNIEKTPVNWKHVESDSNLKLEKVSTPKTSSIEDVAKLLEITAKETIKSVYLVTNDGRKVLVFLRGDRELNEVKLNNHLGSSELRNMSDKEASELGIVTGFCGPKQFPKELISLYDTSISKTSSYVAGANEIDFHYKNFILNRDYPESITQLDLSKSEQNDPCPSCESPLSQEKGIEVGHIFKLGEKYSKAFDIKVLDKQGKSRLVTMGCYGIGVNRTMATVIEQANDEKGIQWPISIAPFEVALVSIAKGKEELEQVEKIYKYLLDQKIEVFWDDRDLGPGFKFKDSELIGFPIRITLGKSFFEKKEYTILNRKTNEEATYSFQNEKELLDLINSMRVKLFQELEA